LSQFQTIADQNPDSNGHGNRDTGTSGYAASVKYVAGLMTQAGYAVTIQSYVYTASEVSGTPSFATRSGSFALGRDWLPARLSGAGAMTTSLEPPGASLEGCDARDFAGFTKGRIALIERGGCSYDVKVDNARAAGAAAVILFDDEVAGVHEARLVEPATVPVVGLATNALGRELLGEYRSGRRPVAHVDIQTKRKSGVDYNVIADSPYGDPNRLVAIDGHLDSIYGAGMLDNASGSTTILDVALNLAKTPTRNRLRYIWFGGEELGLLGSHYYTKHLTAKELAQFAFDVDVDVTATPNYDVLVADPKYASNAKHFPKNVVPQSELGNGFFADFFKGGRIVSQPARFGNDGTDSNSFSLAGVPNTGILTNQDCCKRDWETAIWGGYLGNYEGLVPSFNGGCVDYPHRWCDNLSNNDPDLFELISRSVAYVTFKLANARLR
jgi:Zn-dependent M28 family amino/carboxypeptidase